MMDATWSAVTGWAGCHWLNGRVVLANEYIYYIVKKTWHSTGGCHCDRMSHTWPGVTDRMSLAGRSSIVPCWPKNIYII